MKDVENIFFYGAQDKDTMHESVAEGDFLDAQNIRTLGNTEGSKGKITKVKGTTEIGNPYRSIWVGSGYDAEFVESYVYGSTRNEHNKKIYYFTKEWFNVLQYSDISLKSGADNLPSQYAIYEIDLKTNEITCIVKTTIELFGTEYISVDELDGYLYWASGIEMKSIDIEKGKNWFKQSIIGEDIGDASAYPVINEDVLDLINRPVALLPKIRYSNNPYLTTNNLRGKLFKFRFQYSFNDGSVSVLSPESKVLLPINELLSDGNFDLSHIYNEIKIDKPENVPEEVKSIRIFEAHTLEDEGIWSEYAMVEEIFDWGADPFIFRGGISGRVISVNDDTKPYDSVMRDPLACSIVSNPDRLVIGNGKEGRDNIDVDCELEQETLDIKTEYDIDVTSYVAPYIFKIDNVIPTWEVSGITSSEKRLRFNIGFHGAGVCNVFNFTNLTSDDVHKIQEDSTFKITISYISESGTTYQEEIEVDTSSVTNRTELVNAVKNKINGTYGNLYSFANKSEFMNYMQGEIVYEDANPDGIIGDYDYATYGTEPESENKRHWLIPNLDILDFDEFDWAIDDISDFLGSIPDSSGASDGYLYVRTGSILTDNTGYIPQDVRLKFNQSLMPYEQWHSQSAIDDDLAENNYSYIQKWIQNYNLTYRFINNFLSGEYSDGDTTWDDIEFSNVDFFGDVTGGDGEVSVQSGLAGSLLTEIDIQLTDNVVSLTPFGEYDVGIIYYDKYLRSSFVQKAGTLKIDPSGNHAHLDHVSYRAKVKINHAPPSWAKYWSYGITENKKFIHLLNIPTSHIDQENDNEIVLWDAVVNAPGVGIKIRINQALQSWRNAYSGFVPADYKFESGDRCVIYSGYDGYIDKEIIDQDDDGNIYLDHPSQDGIWDQVFIYRPRKETIDYTYYEVGGLNPIKGSKHFLYEDGNMYPAQGQEMIINYGDSYVTITHYLLRKYDKPYPDGDPGSEDFYYDINAFNPYYSFFYSSNVNSLGRMNSVYNDAKEKRYSGRYRWSNAYFSEIEAKGTNTFDSANYGDLSSKYGGILELHEVGYTLKAIMPSKIISIYVGRSSPVNPDGTEDIILTSSPLGTVSVPSYDYGCQHPKSIIKHNRYLYFVDAANGVVIRDAANGQQIIAGKMSSFWKEKLDAVVKAGYDIIGTYDKANREYGITIVDDNLYTYIFDEDVNGWKGHRTYGDIENGEYTGQYFVSFYKGLPYLHNTGDYGVFADGEQNESYITFVVNKNPNHVKTLKAIAEHSNGVWDARENGDVEIPSSITYPNGMSSRLMPAKFKDKEGTFYAEFMRDGTTPSMDYNEGIINGRNLKYRTAKITLRNNDNKDVNLFSVSIKSTLSGNTY